jgi:hypothetical protein
MQKSSLYVLLLAALCACKKDEERPVPQEDNTTTLEVQVYNTLNWSSNQPAGTLTPGATVLLYKSRALYNSNTAAYTQTTDANGKATFAKIDTGTYYIVARTAEASNVLDATQVDGAYVGYVADSVYQTQTEVAVGPTSSLAFPGNLRLQDLNGDSKIDLNDKTLLPAQSARATANATVSARILIGKLDNRPDPNFANKAAVNEALQATYASLSKWHELQVSIDAVYTDDYDCGSLGAEWCTLNGYTGVVNTNATTSRFWKDGYQIISQLNRVIAYAPKVQDANMTTAEKDRFVALAKGMKGYVYLNLVNYFGGVPRLDSINMLPSASRLSEAATHTYIEGMLTDAFQVITDDEAVMNQQAINALFARLYLQQARFVEARSRANVVISRTALYQLQDTTLIFSQPNNKEIIWQTAAAPQTAPLTSIFNRGAFLPEIRLSEMFFIRAECYLATADLQIATDALNVLIEREHRTPLQYDGNASFAEVLREALQAHQKRHMRLEGIRFAALKRWNMLMPVLAPLGFEEYNRYLPIPQEIIEAYPGIYQNAGY